MAYCRYERGRGQYVSLLSSIGTKFNLKVAFCIQDMKGVEIMDDDDLDQIKEGDLANE